MSMTTNKVTNQSISLGDIATACSSIGNLLGALSDQNSLAMIVGSSGKVTFTNQASRVLAETLFDHPLQKIIVGAANQYHNETGDDCKHFLLLLNEILWGANNMLKSHPEIELRKTLSHEIFLLSSVMPDVLKYIENAHTVISSPVADLTSFFSELEGIVLTFFESKFSLFVAKDLSRVLSEFLLETFADWSHIDQLPYVIENLDIFCSKVACPPSESKVLKGFVLNQSFVERKELLDVSFVVVWELHEKMDGAIWSVDAESISLGLSNPWKGIEKALIALKSKGISVVLTHHGASDNLKLLFLKSEILLFSRIEINELHNIFLFLNITPLSHLSDIIQTHNVGHLKRIQSISGSLSSYTHLETVSCAQSFLPCHILLGATVPELWKEYYTEFCNCLKVVKQWLRKDGQFSLVPRKEVNMYQLRNNTPNHESMLFESKHANEDSSDTAASNESFSGTKCMKSSKDKPTHSPIGISLPLGLFEYSFMVGLKTINNKMSTFKNLFNVLDIAFLKVGCKIWGISVKKFEGEKSFLEFYGKMKCRIVNPVIPLACKEKQMYKILQLLEQLLRIDAIVSIK